MARDSVNIVEKHVDKIVLGLGGAFALAMLWMYLIQNPNQVEYQNEMVGPRELDEKVLASAQNLKNRIANARPPEVTVTRYSDELRKSLESGLFDAAGAAPLPEELPRVASFGQPIGIEGLEELEGSTDVKLVTPLPPLSAPKVITGRSVALRKPPPAPGQAPPPPADPEKGPQTEEFPWVSLAAYFPLDAQRDEMTKARYATYRTKVYIAGVDVQRQEMLSTGEFSEWQDVTNSKGEPDIRMPDPVFDDRTGEMVNKDAVEQAYQTVRESQQLLAQPPFFPVEVGDAWQVPPIEGYEPVVVEEKPVVNKGDENQGRIDRRPTGRPVAPPSGRGDGAVGVEGGPARAVAPVVNTQAQERREALAQMREDWNEAKKAYGKKEYDRSAQFAQQVLNNSYVSAGYRNKAEQLLKAIESRRSKLRAGGPTWEVLPRLITHPEKADVIPVWFHDDTVEAGKTYRYRLRVNLWNRYVGQISLVANPEEAKQSVIHGEWSEPSEPISVTPSTYFFLANAFNNETTVEVYKWRKGEWLKERFPVQVGDTIGGVKSVTTSDYDDEGRPLRADIDFNTGAVVLDLRYDETVPIRMAAGKKGEFTYRPQQTLVMTYLEPADGQVKERILDVDRHNPVKKKLEEEGY